MLFSRNCQSTDQIKRLTAQIKQASPRTKIFIDEEGGRVTRLPYPQETPPQITKPQNAKPQITKPKPASYFGELYATSPAKALAEAKAQAVAIATRLRALHIDANCAPVLDTRHRHSHLVIGNRSYGSDLEAITALGDATIAGFLDQGIQAVIKHIPGHGRATADSHTTLPVVSEDLATLSRDATPFRVLGPKVDFAMTAHIVYPAIDPHLPASLSPKAVEFIRHQLGFSGTLVADAIEMGALDGEGDITARTLKALAAGVDVVIYARAGNNGEMKHLLEAVADG